MSYEKKAALFQTLSHPVRLEILNELRSREACVCHLQALTGRPQAYISQQLRLLRDADLVMDVKDGQNVFYHLKNQTLRDVLQETFGPPEGPSHPTACTCPFCTSE